MLINHYLAPECSSFYHIRYYQNNPCFSINKRGFQDVLRRITQLTHPFQVLMIWSLGSSSSIHTQTRTFFMFVIQIPVMNHCLHSHRVGLMVILTRKQILETKMTLQLMDPLLLLQWSPISTCSPAAGVLFSQSQAKVIPPTLLLLSSLTPPTKITTLSIKAAVTQPSLSRLLRATPVPIHRSHQQRWKMTRGALSLLHP